MGRLIQLIDINEVHTIEARWQNNKKKYYLLYLIYIYLLKTSEEVIGKQKGSKKNSGLIQCVKKT